jgi:hypothetical protein
MMMIAKAALLVAVMMASSAQAAAVDPEEQRHNARFLRKLGGVSGQCCTMTNPCYTWPII